MQVGIRTLLLAAVLATIPSVPATAQAQAETLVPVEFPPSPGKKVLGWVERIRLLPGNTVMKAKLDPGANSSVIHAEEIEAFDKDGQRMVRFTLLVDHDDPDSARIVMEREFVRRVAIKLRNTTRRDRRPVVRLDFCLAGELYQGMFSLTNRSNFNYPVLLGRRFLSDKVLVDSSVSFTQKTGCPDA